MISEYVCAFVYVCVILCRCVCVFVCMHCVAAGIEGVGALGCDLRGSNQGQGETPYLL